MKITSTTTSLAATLTVLVASTFYSITIQARPPATKHQKQAQKSKKKCPADMAPVPGLPVCIDRYEASFKVQQAQPKGTEKNTENGSARAHPLKALSRAGVMPARNISWTDAKKACQNSAKRLCSMDEWQRACAGTGKKRRYPYGDEYRKALCWDRWRSQKYQHQGPAKTGSAPACRNPQGVYDLSGNVWEWIADRGPGGEPAFMLGSGSNNDSKGKLSCDPGKHIGQPSNSKASALGFRCCKDM